MYRRSYRRGGRISYGLGGALLTVGKNLAEGKGFGSGALQGVGKAAVTPGSAIGAGAGLAGNLLQNTNNPLAQKIGQGLDVASNFAPGGGGIAGAVGDVAGLVNQGAAAGAGGAAAGVIGNIAQNIVGQGYGGRVGLIKAERGVNTNGANGEDTDPPSIPQYGADPSLGFAAGTMGRKSSGPGGRPEELMDFAAFYKKQTGEDMPGVGSFPERYGAGSPDKNLDPSLYYPNMDEATMAKANNMLAWRGQGASAGWQDFDARNPEEYGGATKWNPRHAGMDNARSASQVYDKVKEQEAAYHDYMSSWSPVEPREGRGYSFEEGPGGEGGTLKVTNAQRQSNGGMIYAQAGANIPKDPKAAGSPDNRSWAQMLADELSQIYAGVENVVDRSGTEYSPRTDSIYDLFTRGYAAQERADAAREESGASGRVDAAMSALGAADRALSGPAPTKIGGDEWGGPSNPFSAMSRAYDRARMTDEARNASRQFAGGRVRLMKR